MSLFRKKPISRFQNGDSGLARALGTSDLIFLGIGAVVGAGIFVLTGVAAATAAGPAIVLSFILAGTACMFAALSYAELAAAIGGSGSAYGYAYAGFGEIVAWLIGWDLMLEYALAVSAVAVGWAGYVDNALTAAGLEIPAALLHSPQEGGMINLPAVLIILALGGLLAYGVKASARFNAVIVTIKLIAILVFLGVASSHVQPDLWKPFMPFGWSGVAHGAALVFFAYIGFDAVSTAADETRNPQRDLPLGIIGSLIICTVLYIAVAGLLTLISPYPSLNVSSPVSAALLSIGSRSAAAFVAAGAIAGLTSVMLVSYYGQTRIFLAMTRDGLLPPVFGEVHSGTRTPIKIILICGVLMALIAGFVPLDQIAELVNIGTLAAFALVCGGVVVLRKQQPGLERPFKTPWSPAVPVLGIVFCVYLMANLPAVTWLRFVVWMSLGLAVYFGYAKRHSALANEPPEAI
jgi:APA family basic amino acid/polyamine antiporter